MLATVLGNLGTLAQATLGAMGEVVQFWPVTVMGAFLILGVGTANIKKLAGARRSKRRRA